MAPDATPEQILRGSGGLTRSRPPRFDDSVEKWEELKPALVKTARKKTVTALGGFAYVVDGTKQEKHEKYHVEKRGQKWWCTCYDEQYGDVRERNVCSHVMAAWVYLKERGEDRGEGQDSVTPALSPETDPPRVELHLFANEPGPDVGPDVGPNADLPVQRSEEKKAEPKKKKAKKKAKAKASPAILHPTDPAINHDGWQPVPFEEYRPDQVTAALEVMDAYRDGAQVVFLDAPTGAGKTGIADLVSRLSYQPAVYMCSTKSLQDQVEATFDYAKVIKGRRNYPTLKAPFPEVTADDCTGSHVDANDCMFCDPMARCPYRVAKSDALRAQLAVLNTAFWLREANGPGGFRIPPMEDPRYARAGSRRQGYGGLFVVDECDLLANALYGYIEFAITDNRARTLGVTPPKKGSHKQTIQRWMVEELVPAASRAMKREVSMGSLESMRRARGLQTLIQQAKEISTDITDDNWIRDNTNDRVPLLMKPVHVAPYTKDLLWGNVGRVLMMSATVISSEQMAEQLGFEGEFRTVRVPMRFKKKRRRIIAAPIVEMRGGQANGIASGAWDEMANGIANILDLHPGEKTLIHAVSYGLARHLMLRLRHETQRPLFTYSRADERDDALARYRASVDGIMVAPSLDRGIDLADDDCRVVVVAKIPYPNLGDPQVSALLHSPGGEEWMAVETIRTLVQMTGRGVRHAKDSCVTYITDAQFTTNLLRRNKNLLPGWWRDALDTGFNVRQLTQQRG